MAPTLDELRAYDAGYNHARKHYDDDDLACAIAVAEDMLNDPRLPRYHRIRLLLLIASSAADWFVAKDLIERADVQFRMEKTVRRRPDGEEDRIIRELREELAAVKEQHEAEQPRDEDFEAMEEARLEEEEFADEDDFAGEKDEFADSTGNIVRERDEVAGEVDKSVPKDELAGGEAEAVVRDYPEDKSADTARGRQDDPEKVEEQRPSAEGKGKASTSLFSRISWPVARRWCGGESGK